jgi:hypothetical protein
LSARARSLVFAAAVFALTGLGASRVTLVGHELVGHGAVAAAQGCDIVAYRLFLFGGGWVSYDCDGSRSLTDALAVSLGGIVVEVVLAGLALWVASRLARGSVARVALVSLATVDLLHAGFYLAAGTHHGFGDGHLLHEALGGWRPLLVIPASMAVIAGGALLAWRLAREVGGWVQGRVAARIGTILAAAVVAGAVHGALTASERALRSDDVYARIMRHQSEREVSRDLDRFRRDARARGRAPTAAELAAARAAFEALHRRFPLRAVLAVALGLACLFGLWWGMRDPAPDAAGLPARWRALVPLGAVTLGSVIAVYLIDLGGG